MTAAEPKQTPPRVFSLEEVCDDGTSHFTYWKTERERDAATLSAIWFGGLGEDNAEEAEGYLETLREKGLLTFEGDAPLKWHTLITESSLAEAVNQARANTFLTCARHARIYWGDVVANQLEIWFQESKAHAGKVE